MSVSSGTMSVGVMAVFSGLLGAYGLRALLLAEPPRPQVPTTMIVPLATADLPPGRIIKFGDVGIHRMTSKQLAERGLANPSVMMAPEQVMGRRVRYPIRQGEPFLTTGLYLEGESPNLSELLKPGLRAVSVQVSDLRAGYCNPGSYVDVVFRANSGKTPAGLTISETTLTLFEGVEVLWVERPKAAADGGSGNLDIRRINGRDYRPPPLPVVSMAVNAEQANMLRTVEGRGELTLVPRSEDDLDRISSTPGKKMTLEDLLQIAPPGELFKTEIYRRTSRELRVFGADETTTSAPPPVAPADTVVDFRRLHADEVSAN